MAGDSGLPPEEERPVLAVPSWRDPMPVTQLGRRPVAYCISFVVKWSQRADVASNAARNRVTCMEDSDDAVNTCVGVAR
jgi:hypothetical protein